MKIAVLLILTFFSQTAFSQHIIPFQSQTNILFGLKDSVTNKIILSPKYDVIYPIVGGYFMVGEISEQVYEVFEGYSSNKGQNRFEDDQIKYGLMDQNGTLLLPEKYQDFAIFPQDLIKAIFVFGAEQLFDVREKKFIGDIYADLSISWDDKTVIDITTRKNEKFKLDLNRDTIPNNSIAFKQFNIIKTLGNGNYIVTDSSKKYGIVNPKGKIIVAINHFRIEKMGYNVDGVKDNILQVIEKTNVDNINRREYYLINYNGERITTKNYSSISLIGIHGNYIDAYTNNGHALLDIKGKGIIQKEYQDITMQFENQAVIKVQENNFIGMIDTSGKYILKPIYDDINYSIGTLFTVTKNKKMGVAHIKNGLISDLNYHRVFYIRENSPAIIWKKDGNKDKMGLIDENGNIISNFQYPIIKEYYADYFGPKFKNNRLIINNWDGKYGAIDKKGKQMIPAKFDHLNEFNNPTTTAKLNDKYYIVDTNGILISPAYDTIISENKVNSSYIIKDNQYGLLNSAGKQILESIYDTIYEFSNSICITKRDGVCKIYNISKAQFYKNQIDDIYQTQGIVNYVFNNYLDKKVLIIKSKTGYGAINNLGSIIISPKHQYDPKLNNETLTHHIDFRYKGYSNPIRYNFKGYRQPYTKN